MTTAKLHEQSLFDAKIKTKTEFQSISILHRFYYMFMHVKERKTKFGE